MIYVTHDQVEAMTLADQIVVLRAGRIEQVGTPLELYNRPANRFVAGFIGSPRMNFLDGPDRGGRRGRRHGRDRGPARRGRGRRPAGCRGASRSRWACGPSTSMPGRGGRASFAALVEATEQLGSDSYLYCALPQGQKLTIHHPGQTAVRRGERTPIGCGPRPATCSARDEDGRALPRLA